MLSRNALPSRQAVIMLKGTRLLLVALSSLVVGTTGLAQTAAKLPADSRFDAPVTVDVVNSGLALDTYLKALGMSVKLNIITEGIPDKKVNYDFNGKPFRQAWEYTVRLNGLDFEMFPNDIVIVGPPDRIAAVRPPAPVAAPVVTTTTPEPVQTERRFYPVNTDPAALQGLLSKEVPGVQVSTLAASRVLIVTGTAQQHADVRAILNQVDLAPNTPNTVATIPVVRRLFTLSNAKAGKLAAVLKETLSGPQVSTANGTTTTTSTTAPGAPAATNATNVTITADENTNALIVSGPQDQVDQIAALIPQLDRRQSLVNVGVRIQEVSDDAGRSLGIDWSFGFGNFAGKVLNTGLGFLFDATKSLAGLNIGAALNALEEQQLSRKVNDSTITVVNNGSGTLNSGGRIEISIPSSSGSQGGINKTLEYGVIITVNPQVAADGTITMGVKAEVSDVLNPNSVDPQRVDFTRQASDTVVILQDGQTLLLGSLLATKQDSRTTGVPLLSAIPLIGDLFKTTKVSTSQKQLLIVLTVNVVK